MLSINFLFASMDRFSIGISRRFCQVDQRVKTEKKISSMKSSQWYLAPPPPIPLSSPRLYFLETFHLLFNIREHWAPTSFSRGGRGIIGHTTHASRLSSSTEIIFTMQYRRILFPSYRFFGAAEARLRPQHSACPLSMSRIRHKNWTLNCLRVINTRYSVISIWTVMQV